MVLLDMKQNKVFYAKTQKDVNAHLCDSVCFTFSVAIVDHMVDELIIL